MMILPACLVVAILAASGGQAAPSAPALYRAPPIPNMIDGVTFGIGNWKPWLAAGDKGDSWGNHRAVIEVPAGTGDAVRVTIPWRRHDEDPGAKDVVVVNAQTGLPVNSFKERIANVSGDIVFQAAPAGGTYHVYYMPWRSGGGYYPKVTYPAVMHVSDSAWLQRVRATDARRLPMARVSRIEAITPFHSFFPMEVIATPEESAALLARAGGWAVVAEHRDYPVRMWHHIPQPWVHREQLDRLDSKVLRGESFTFQVAVVAGSTPLDSLDVRFEGFPDAVARALTCFNCGGIDENGHPFRKVVSVPPGTVQPLWIGWIVPDDQPAGMVTGRVVIQPRGQSPRPVTVRLEVRPELAVNHGYDEPEMMTRLAWLNSTAGSDPDAIIAPFTPVEVRGHDLGILGRRIALGADGFPTTIESYFGPDNSAITTTPQPILAAPLQLQLVAGGQTIPWVSAGDYRVERLGRGAVAWRASASSEAAAMAVEGRLEYDGMLSLRVRLQARKDLSLDDIRVPVRYRREAATYMLGLGREGGLRPDSLDWQWAVEKHQEGLWFGGINAGLQYVLRDDAYLRPLNTNFYQNQPLRMPAAWYNAGKGGIRIWSRGGEVVAENYSGPRRMAAGDTLQFDIRFLVTPFKPIDTREHFRTRFVHRYVPVDSVTAWGGTVVNIHHANEINPYINYPFFNLEAQSAYITEAHAQGVKVKLYDTIRELTYRTHELFALRSLGDEIFNDGEGGGHSWLQEHLGGHYHAGWHAYSVDDAAILDKGTSRWTNYYIEGLAWLASHQKIDGLYLDDIAFSRETVKRLVTVMHQSRDTVVIDLHSANQFNPRDGFTNSAMLYMEHFPFISRLWFGEYFDYSKPPAFFMAEVAGLPFGLMGEMLQDGGQPWRGLVYGMTSRFWGETDPRPVWKLMDDFGIADSRMLGYWLRTPPVTLGNDALRATAYIKDDAILLAIGSWSKQDETVAVRLDPALTRGWGGVRAEFPAVAGLQAAGSADLARLVVPADKGAFVLLRRTP